MSANIWRGEVEIMLAAKPYVLRPTFEALCAIEQELGIGLIALARKLADGNITLEELETIITKCLTEPALVREVMVSSGITQAVEAVFNMFALVFGGLDEITSA